MAKNSKLKLFLTFILLIGCAGPQSVSQSKGKGPKPKPPPESVQMAFRFFDTYARAIDTAAGSRYPFRGDVAGFGTVTSPVRYDGRSLNGSSTEFSRMYDYGISTAVGNTAYNIVNSYLSFYFRIASAPTVERNVAQIRITGGANKIRIVIPASTTQLRLEDTSFSTLGTSSALTTDTWYRIDLLCGTGASANYELRIHEDGSPGTSNALSGTGDLNTNNAAFYDLFAKPEFYTSHLVLDDSAYVANGNDYRIDTIFPNGNGNYTSWTGDYTDVDDIKHDATTTEISTSIDTNRETVTLEDISLSAGESVLSVMNVYHMRKEVNAAVNVQVIDRLSTTDRDSTSFLLAKNDGGDQDQIWFVIYDTKPGGGSWTESDVNGYEIGLEHNQTQVRAIFCTAMNTNVLIEIPAVGGGSANAGRMTLLGVQ